MKIEGQPFEIQIIGDDDQPIAETAKGYAGLDHGEQYKIRIRNSSDTRAAIHFEIDGTPFSKELVVGANATADLETIPDTGKRFTFFAQDSDEAKQALLDDVSPESLGVVSATFKREKKYEPPARLSFADFGPMRGGGGMMRGGGDTFGGGAITRGGGSLGAGGTGLSGYSGQTFGTTIFNTDESIPPVTINLRLAHEPNRQRALDAHPIPGRAKPVANDVPPPVGNQPKQEIG